MNIDKRFEKILDDYCYDMYAMTDEDEYGKDALKKALRRIKKIKFCKSCLSKKKDIR